jgi:2-polyprenyl-3-methyl-5-hydroxy-6-metoxy-1,4-benzoquinol methylase
MSYTDDSEIGKSKNMKTKEIDSWYLENLVDPIDKTPLTYIDSDNRFMSTSGNFYPVVAGVPVMLVNGIDQTIELAHKTLDAANEKTDPFYINTLGITEREKNDLKNYILSQSQLTEFAIDPIVSFLVAATNGILYKESINRLKRYPIPNLRLPDSSNHQQLLDVGCSWGRWCLAAAQKGYAPIGIDPSLGAVLAGQRIAKSLGLEIKFVVGDARYLPFKENLFDTVFSYSVLQHFSKQDVKLSLREIHGVLKAGGESLIQMPNQWGIRSLQHQIMRKFRQPQGFDVRYWSPQELGYVFNELIGDSQINIDGFFGLGIQASDLVERQPSFNRQDIRFVSPIYSR